MEATNAPAHPLPNPRVGKSWANVIGGGPKPSISDTLPHLQKIHFDKIKNSICSSVKIVDDL